MKDGNNMIVFESGGGAGLPKKAFAGRCLLGYLGQHGLDGDGAVEVRILRLKDDPHAPLAQHLQDAIGAQAT